MMRSVILGLVLVLGFVFVAPSFADTVAPAYHGRLGNYEEPAMRPYKWFWNGVKALFYNPVARFTEGNARYPGLGTVNVGKGAVQGTVELGEGVYKGSIYAIPPQKKQYKTLGDANTFIANDPLLEGILDLPLAIPTKIEGDEKAQARQDAVLKAAAETRAARKAAADSEVRTRARGPKMSSYERDRESYIGERARINEKPAVSQDLTQLPR